MKDLRRAANSDVPLPYCIIGRLRWRVSTHFTWNDDMHSSHMHQISGGFLFLIYVKRMKDYDLMFSVCLHVWAVMSNWSFIQFFRTERHKRGFSKTLEPNYSTSVIFHLSHATPSGAALSIWFWNLCTLFPFLSNLILLYKMEGNFCLGYFVLGLAST